MKRVGQPSHLFAESKIGDTVYNKRLQAYGTVIGRGDSGGCGYRCSDCKIGGISFHIEKLGGERTYWCYGLWRER